MRLLAGFLLTSVILLSAPASDEEEAVATVQRTFDGIAAHDGDMVRSSMLPDARICAARDANAPINATLAELTDRVAAEKRPLLERFTSPPRVLIRGRIAQVWGEYEFLLDNKVSHCGVDAASLIKTPEGWKIATIVYTSETTGCKGQ
jgi:hypothetical protein